LSARVPALAPFGVRSFRFQWPADLAASCAFEMETLILGWYILVETQSVFLLTVFASLQFLGTLVSPLFGVAGHRIGNKNLLCAMRATYATLATALMTFASIGVLTPVHVFVIAALMGLVRPSDLVMRYALIGETIPAGQLVGATSVSRTTQDSARIAGALTGAGLMAALGMGPAYAVIAGLYAVSFLLTLQTGRARFTPPPDAAGVAPASSPWRDLKDAFGYVWHTPPLLAAMALALLVNLTAFPLVNALLPYVAKEIYLSDQTGLGYLVASFATGALLGSIVLSHTASRIRLARMMVVFCAIWYVLIFGFAQMQSLASGIVLLTLTGCAQSLSMISMQAMLLRNTSERVRGPVLGIRQLMVYGMPVGLLISGPVISRFGYPFVAMVYCAIGLAFTLLIAVRWRDHLWRPEAPANTR
jgi:MFS family permease